MSAGPIADGYDSVFFLEPKHIPLQKRKSIAGGKGWG